MFGRDKPLALAGRVEPGDAAYMSSVNAAHVVEATPHVNWALYLMLLSLVAGLLWASLAQVEVITRADARIIPEAREQVVASLEGGILSQLMVREGQAVEAGQELAHLDPTRFEAQQNEGQARRLALKATVARLQAEAAGRALQFPPDVLALAALVDAETAAYTARRHSLDDSVSSNARSIELVMRELNVAQAMSSKGLMSEVEVMRLRRQVNDLRLQNQERINRFRQEASTELLRVRSELAQLEEQQVVREDQLRRTVLKSPVRGLVKNIRVMTVGGVVAGGAPIMEIVPLGPRVLIEARVKPADIGFIRVGQTAEIKLSAYEYNIYGGLRGTVEYISPDALGDAERQGGADGTYYRALIRADSSSLKAHGEALPILPGMTGVVEVNTQERTVMSFLLQPLLKSREAFRER
jgi:adhesin transport system membrane fusion protein